MDLLSGKRKRREIVKDDNSSSENHEHMEYLQATLKQHFETKFEPLTAGNEHDKALSSASESEISDCEYGWSGFSEVGQESDVTTVDHQALNAPPMQLSKLEKNHFMTVKPPQSSVERLPIANRTESIATRTREDEADAANLQKDLALQRLLKESHLLDSESSLSLSGKKRQKALDSRLQDLGSRSSIFIQHKMPLAERKGIAAKTAQRDIIRRQQAKENGIILEKAVKSRRKFDTKRQRGIGAPAIGKFRGGMLKLSQKDVAGIVGPKRRPKTRK